MISLKGMDLNRRKAGNVAWFWPSW